MGRGGYLDSGCFLLWSYLFHLHPRPNSPRLPAPHPSAGASRPLLPSEAWLLGHSEGWGGEGILCTRVTTEAAMGVGVRCGAGWVLGEWGGEHSQFCFQGPCCLPSSGPQEAPLGCWLLRALS